MAENIIDLNITVEDENDCTPVIKAQQVGSVNESSAVGMSSLHSVTGWLLFFFIYFTELYCFINYLFIFIDVFFRYPGDESDRHRCR